MWESNFYEMKPPTREVFLLENKILNLENCNYKIMKERTNFYSEDQIVRRDIWGNPVILNVRIPSDPDLQSPFQKEQHRRETAQLFADIEAFFDNKENLHLLKTQIEVILEDLNF